MRRAERAVTDLSRILAFLNACPVCRLGLVDEGRAYVVPLSFGFARQEGKLIFYFHSALEGRKIDLLRADSQVTLELDLAGEIHGKETGCSYTTTYFSLMGEGKVEFLDDPAQRELALRQLLAHYGVTGLPLEESVLQKTAVFSVTLDQYTCKEGA